MKANIYEKFKNRVENSDFFVSFKYLNFWLTIFSYFGNIVSIFFAYFLMTTLLDGAIKNNLPSLDGTYFSSIISLVFLIIFEYSKRDTFSEFSIDLLRQKFRITKKVGYLLIASILLFSASFYFSLSGVLIFSTATTKVKEEVSLDIKNEKDSVRLYYEKIKEPLIKENNIYRESNQEVLSKIATTNASWLIKNYNQQIESNNSFVERNNKELSKIDSAYQLKISLIDQIYSQVISESEDSDYSNKIKFFILSTFIEFIIIFCVFFNNLYIYNSYKDNFDKHETNIVKRKTYTDLLKFLYRNGEVRIGEQVIGFDKFKLLLQAKNYTVQDKTVRFFFEEITHLNIIKTDKKRRYFVIDFDEAKQILNKDL